MKFGPADENETLTFAVEELRAEIQYDILRSMKQANMSQADLARKLKVSQAWVSQVLGDDANLTLETVAKVYLALGAQCKLHSSPAREHIVRPAGAFTESAVEWKESSRPVVSSDTAEKKASNTTRLLMNLIANNCRGSKPVLVGNDNVSDEVTRVREEEVA